MRDMTNIDDYQIKTKRQRYACFLVCIIQQWNGISLNVPYKYLMYDF